MGNQQSVKNSSTPTRNPNRVWGSKFVIMRSSHQFNQIQIRTSNGLGALVQSDEINSESSTFHWHVWMGNILWLLIPSCQWIYNRLWSRNTWWIQHPLTTKRLRVELNVTDTMIVRALYWQFSWDMVPSKLMTHKRYRLLRRRSLSLRQSKLSCWQLRKRYKAYLLTRYYCHPLYQLPGCRPECLSQNMYNIAGGFDDEEQAGASTPTLDMGNPKSSRYEVDSSLPKATRASHISVFACDTPLLFLVIACFYLMPCQ